MKSYLAPLFAASAAHALVARTSICCFHLTAAGGPGGVVGQLDDGQNRIGQGLAEAQYCIDNGGLTDQNGRGCILTPPTTQFQCDVGATPTTGFSIDCDGELAYNGDTTFWSCPTGDSGGYNIYTVPPTGQDGCVTITLTADGCASACPLAACPADLSGNYEFPHLIIPVDSTQPDTAFGTQYNGAITSTVSTIFDFDIPTSDAGKTCSLVFLFPTQANLVTSSYTFSGAGAVDFAMLVNPADENTNYANAPAVVTDYGTFTVTPGTSTVIATFECPAGQRVAYELGAVGDTELTYFQDYNPEPIGLYVTSC